MGSPCVDGGAAGLPEETNRAVIRPSQESAGQTAAPALRRGRGLIHLQPHILGKKRQLLHAFHTTIIELEFYVSRANIVEENARCISHFPNF